MPLQVIVIHREESNLKEPLESLLNACREMFNFAEPCWKSWNERQEQIQSLLEEKPTFWLLEVPDEKNLRGRARFGDLLKTLDEHQRSWVYVLSSREQFDSDEAARMWLQHRCVVNYSLIRHLNLQELRELLGRLVEWVPAEAPNNFPIGNWMEIPVGEYEQRKFVSLFLGGMRSVLWEVKRFLRTLDEKFPPPYNDDLKLQHPFLEGERLLSPQEQFDKIVGRPGRESGGIPSWMRDLWKKRSYTLPHLLILGETGTGKTLLARFLHRHRFAHSQARHINLSKLCEAEQQLIDDLIIQELNCGAISEKLITGELFGAKAGAWTNLEVNLPGKIFCACLGTLMLDEIGSLPQDAQTTLLKYLDDYTYTPVGWMGERFYVPAVIIAATNQPLERLVEEGQFRQDLYERFRFRIRLPSLKERMDHFEELVDFVLQNPKINPVIDKTERKRRVNSISEEALQRLRRHGWPGNFRELEQVIWQAVDAAYEEGLDILLPRHIRLPSSPNAVCQRELH